MTLFEEVDKKATEDRVRDFFHQDLQKYLQICGKHRADLKSPVMNGMPKASPTGNVQEDKMMDIEEAKLIVRCAIKAVYNCEAVSSKILQCCFIDNERNWQVANELGYGHTQFNKKKSYALREFATRFDYLCAANGLNLPSLIIYKKKSGKRVEN